MNKKTNVAVIGVGRMGGYHVGIYSEMADVNLVAVVDPDSERGGALASRYKVSHCKDYREILDKVDAVTVAAPTSLHYQIAKDCLEAGVHCIVEKPICDNYAHAESLFDIAGRKNLTLHVGHVERFNGAVQELRKIVQNPIMIESRRMGPYDPRIKDAGVVLDLMIHDIDILLNLVASPVVDTHVMGTSIFSNREDVVQVQFQFENGCIASVLASRATQEKIRTMAITQEKEYIFLDFAHQDILIHRQASSQHELRQRELKYRQESVIERIFVHRDNPLKLELTHFLDCATNGAHRHISVENELMSLRVALGVLDTLKLARKNLSLA
ncbi:MAG: Gfo/Idh/MocA family oxidoreductase [Nitrospinae bacterium]|nr:Gfo/Idh/MocA family oxidoreductase [Nitrospinota bacterium]